MASPAHILLADEYDIVLQGLVRVIERLPFAAETATARSGREALRLAGEGDFDLCIADPALPDRHQCRLVEGLHTLSPTTRILLHTVEPWTAKQLAPSGVQGVVSKRSGTLTLGRAIACVLAGGQYLDDCLPGADCGGGILALSVAGKRRSYKPLSTGTAPGRLPDGYVSQTTRSKPTAAHCSPSWKYATRPN